MVGMVLGTAGMHILDARAPARATPVAATVDVRVSLGEQAGSMSLVAGQPVVSVPLVRTDAGSRSP